MSDECGECGRDVDEDGVTVYDCPVGKSDCDACSACSCDGAC